MRGSVINAGLGLGDGDTGPRGVPAGRYKQPPGQSARRACRERKAVRNGPLTHASAGTGSSAGQTLLSLSFHGGGTSPGAEAGRVSVPLIRAPYKRDRLR